VILYSHTTTPRLQYIADFIGKEILGEKFNLTTDKNEFINEAAPKINYSDERISNDEFYIKPHSLLFETNIQQQRTEVFEINDNKAFFKTEGDFPFDIFAASFYLLSRYEEYLHHKKDMYGRYSHENSLAFRENFLQLPLINLWLANLKVELQKKFPSLTIHYSQFTFLPTYDIDEAYSYKYKGWFRTMGGYVNSLLKGKFEKVSLRNKVRLGKQKDPFDSYEWMDQLHEKYSLSPKYFFHVGSKKGEYDKNISPSKKEMQDLIRHHAEKYDIGVHPSWQSGDDPQKLKFEILKLGHISGKQIRSSRQHYIRFTLPETYRQLIDAGIENDFSMGYGSINGFRASVASPFYWYDLENEKQTSLLLYPFCYMEANSFFEQKFSPQQALEEMRKYRDVIKSVNGMMITIWHNTFLGIDKLFTGWRNIYEEFIKETVTQTPSVSG
jgi:hypothetical protein